MRFLFVPIVFVVFAGQCLGAAVKNGNCHLERLTSCGNTLDDFRKHLQQSKFPTEVEEVNELCKRMADARACVQKYTQQCMTKSQVQTLEFITEGSLQAYEDFCKEGSQTRMDYLKYAKCMDKSSKTEEAKANYQYIEAALESFAEKSPRDRLTTACCGYAWLTDVSQRLGEASCGKAAVEAFEKAVEMATSSLPNIICSGFEPKSETCKAVLPPPGAVPKGKLKKSHIAKTFAARFNLQELN